MTETQQPMVVDTPAQPAVAEIKIMTETQQPMVVDTPAQPAVAEKPAAKVVVRRSRKMKDPNKPKRYSSAYFLFLNENRAQFSEDLEGTGLKGKALMCEISRVGGRKWKETTEEERKKYVEESAKLKLEYEEKMRIYKETAEFKTFQKAFKAQKVRVTVKLAKPDSCPKKAASAYFLWLGENRAALTKECQGKTGRMGPHVCRLAGQRWGALSEEEKKPFQDRAAVLKKEYHEKMAVYRESDEYKTYHETIAKARKAAKGKKSKKKKKKATKKRRKGKKKAGRPKKVVEKEETKEEGEAWKPGMKA